jgi:type I restriction enzyme M protein
MTVETHRQLAGFIWSICDLLRGPYKRSEYRKVILPFTVLRRFDSLLADTRPRVLARAAELAGEPAERLHRELALVAGRPFHNLSPFTFAELPGAPGDLARNLKRYVEGFSPNVREIMKRFSFPQQVARLADKKLLHHVVRRFAEDVDLSPARVDNEQMGYVFEELIRIGAEQSNEEAGEHFTPREVIHLMVELLLRPDRERWSGPGEMLIYDPACGTGGMLSGTEACVRELAPHATARLFGQDLNDESWAVCRSDMLIKGENAENIRLGNSFTHDAFRGVRFDYMLANPPFGVEWKQIREFIERERGRGHAGPFGAGLPRINDGSFLFLQHMLHKMRPAEAGGSRIAIIFNGSPLFAGGAGSGESAIREWIIRNDWLEAVVALPDQLFYNTGIFTYVWVLTNRKDPARKGQVQLIDARRFFLKMKKSLGNKRNRIGGPGDEKDQIGEISRIHQAFCDGETHVFPEGGEGTERVVSRVLDNRAFGFHRVTVERPLRLGFRATPGRIARLGGQPAFRALPPERQERLRALLAAFGRATGGELFRGRDAFLAALRGVEDAEGVRLTAAERKAVAAALGERDPDAEACVGADGRPEPDPELRDTESVPFTDDVAKYFEREVLPHVPDAWIDVEKTRVGFEIPFNRYFHSYEPPRPLEVIEAELRELHGEIATLLEEVTG